MVAVFCITEVAILSIEAVTCCGDYFIIIVSVAAVFTLTLLMLGVTCFFTGCVFLSNILIVVLESSDYELVCSDFCCLVSFEILTVNFFGSILLLIFASTCIEDNLPQPNSSIKCKARAIPYALVYASTPFSNLEEESED